MKRLGSFTVLGLMVAFLLAACGSADNGRVTVTLTDTKITLDRTSVQRGEVTFTVKNAGTVGHELVVLKTDLPQGALPARPEDPSKVQELGDVGEAEDIALGATATLTLKLEPGKYVLICNEPGHYHVGMHVAFEVK